MADFFLSAPYLNKNTLMQFTTIVLWLKPKNEPAQDVAIYRDGKYVPRNSPHGITKSMPDIIDPACAGRHLDELCLSLHPVGDHIRQTGLATTCKLDLVPVSIPLLYQI